VSWRRLAPGVYASTALRETPVIRLEAARLRLPALAAFSGRTAAWLHGLDVSPCEPIEINPRRVELDESEVVIRRGFRTTSLPRTLFDLSRKLSLVEAVAVTDMALHAGLVGRAELSDWIERQPGRKGVRGARRVLEFAESAAESQMETRLRMLLVLNGLPLPEVQATLRDEAGSFRGRLELYYRAHLL
jgi:hypothetical protein